MKLSQRVLNMTESATLLMAQKSRELQSKGIDVINLSLGEPDFNTPQHVIEAAKEGMDRGYTKYTPVNGLPELRKAIVEKFKRDNGLEYSIDQIVVSNGAKQSIANVFLALLDPGEEVIVFSPYWVSYVAMIEEAQGIPVIVHGGVDTDFKPSIADIQKAITTQTRAIIFSSPCNPTGAVWSKEELGALAHMLEGYPDIIVISDEIYEFINFKNEHVSFASMPGMLGRTVTVNGFSKGFAMTGWRLGYIGAPLDLAHACTKIQGQYTSGANAFGQYAAMVALNSPYGPSMDMRDAYTRRLNIIKSRIHEFPELKFSIPDGAFYVFPDVSQLFGKHYEEYAIHTANDLSIYLLEKAHVAVVTGEAFGAPECIRISFAASEEDIIKALDAMKKWIDLLV